MVAEDMVNGCRRYGKMVAEDMVKWLQEIW